MMHVCLKTPVQGDFEESYADFAAACLDALTIQELIAMLTHQQA